MTSKHIHIKKGGKKMHFSKVIIIVMKVYADLFLRPLCKSHTDYDRGLFFFIGITPSDNSAEITANRYKTKQLRVKFDHLY